MKDKSVQSPWSHRQVPQHGEHPHCRHPGISMVSDIAEALSGKRVLGDGVTVPEANLESALYHGASKATQLEAGHALIVSFLKSWEP